MCFRCLLIVRILTSTWESIQGSAHIPVMCARQHLHRKVTCPDTRKRILGKGRTGVMNVVQHLPSATACWNTGEHTLRNAPMSVLSVMLLSLTSTPSSSTRGNTQVKTPTPEPFGVSLLTHLTFCLFQFRLTDTFLAGPNWQHGLFSDTVSLVSKMFNLQAKLFKVWVMKTSV